MYVSYVWFVAYVYDCFCMVNRTKPHHLGNSDLCLCENVEFFEFRAFQFWPLPQALGQTRLNIVAELSRLRHNGLMKRFLLGGVPKIHKYMRGEKTPQHKNTLG